MEIVCKHFRWNKYFSHFVSRPDMFSSSCIPIYHHGPRACTCRLITATMNNGLVSRKRTPLVAGPSHRLLQVPKRMRHADQVLSGISGASDITHLAVGLYTPGSLSNKAVRGVGMGSLVSADPLLPILLLASGDLDTLPHSPSRMQTYLYSSLNTQLSGPRPLLPFSSLSSPRTDRRARNPRLPPKSPILHALAHDPSPIRVPSTLRSLRRVLLRLSFPFLPLLITGDGGERLQCVHPCSGRRHQQGPR